MFRIRKATHFEAAHLIDGHHDPLTGEDGKCSKLHGHSYTIAVCIQAEKVSADTAFVLDYYWIGIFLKQLHERWDHKFLNDDPAFMVSRGFRSTAERIAEVVSEEWQAFYAANSEHMDPYSEIELHYAECKETADTYARHYPLYQN